ADVEVMRLDPALGAGDLAGDERRLDDLPLLHAQPLHRVLQPVGAEQTHQLVVEREIKARGAGVALPAAAAAELVIDSPGLVALCPEDVQSAERDDELLVRLVRRL